MSKKFKKLVSVLAISIFATEVYKKAYIFLVTENSLLFNTPPFERILSILYLMHFKKDQINIQAFLDLGSKINAMTPVYMARLALKVQTIDVKVQKIYGFILKIFGIVLASF